MRSEALLLAILGRVIALKSEQIYKLQRKIVRFLVEKIKNNLLYIVLTIKRSLQYSFGWIIWQVKLQMPHVFYPLMMLWSHFPIFLATFNYKKYTFLRPVENIKLKNKCNLFLSLPHPYSSHFFLFSSHILHAHVLCLLCRHELEPSFFEWDVVWFFILFFWTLWPLRWGIRKE